MAGKRTTADGIARALLAEYPDRRAPYGAWVKIARQLRVTAGRVELVAQRLGFERIPMEEVIITTICAFETPPTVDMVVKASGCSGTQVRRYLHGLKASGAIEWLPSKDARHPSVIRLVAAESVAS
jgi:hypothetical protein